MGIDPPQRRDTILLAAGFEGGLVILALLAGWLLKQPPLNHVHWSVRDAGVGVAASLPMLLGFLVCLRWPVGPLARIKRFSEEFIQPFFQPCTILDLAIISVLAGVGEEMLFRGVLQDSIGGWLGTVFGLAITSIVFGLVHAITPTYAFLASLCGLYLGVLVLQFDNLLVAMIPHALYDCIALVWLARRPLTTKDTKNTKNGEWAALLVPLQVLLLG